ncbi:MAG: DUF2282 domain-containing protein [Burkholderiales bacterium]|nr:DUF2282 domain-containing protein [Burkholderiales bacterium]
MNQRLVVSTVFASLLGLGLVGQAAAADMAKDASKEKCFGIAKAGQNDCANLSGSHSCAGQTKTDGAADDWKYVAKGSCKAMRGLTMDEAKAKLKKS